MQLLSPDEFTAQMAALMSDIHAAEYDAKQDKNEFTYTIGVSIVDDEFGVHGEFVRRGKVFAELMAMNKDAAVAVQDLRGQIAQTFNPQQ